MRNVAALKGSGLVATTTGASPFGLPGRGSALASPWSFIFQLVTLWHAVLALVIVGSADMGISHATESSSLSWLRPDAKTLL